MPARGERASPDRARGGARGLALLALALGATYAYVLVASGGWDPFPIAPPPAMPGGSGEDHRLNQLGSAREFVFERFALPEPGAAISTTVVFRVSGKTLLPERTASATSGFTVEEPRVTIVGRGEQPTTVIRAPIGRFTLAGPGGIRGRLEGGVRLEQPGTAIETEHLDVIPTPSQDAPAAGGRVLPVLRGIDEDDVRLETDTLVSGARMQEETDGTRRLLAFRAENGLEARGDLKRLVLRGPVIAREGRGDLRIEAERRVALALCTQKEYEGWLLKDDEADPEDYVLKEVEASGNAFLHVRREATETRREVDVTVAGDEVRADLSKGTCDVTGSPGVVEDRVQGQTLRGRHITANDDGRREGLLAFRSEDGASYDVAIRHMRSELFPRRWDFSGEAIEGTLRKTITEKDRRKGRDEPRIKLARSVVTSSPAHPGKFSTHGAPRGDWRGTFSRLVQEEDESERLTVHAKGGEGSPLVEVLSEDSRIVAREADLTQCPNDVNTNAFVKLQGDVVALVGTDLVTLAREQEATSAPSPEDAILGSGGGPYLGRGERADLELNTHPVRRTVGGVALPWYERSALVTGRLEGAPAVLDGKDPLGRAFSLGGTALDVRTDEATVAALSSGGAAPAVAVLGSSSVCARELRGNLKSGELSGEGEVRARGELPASPGETPRDFALDAASGSVTLEPDRERNRVAREARARDRALGRLPVELPPEVLAFRAEGDARERVIARLPGKETPVSSLEADHVEWDARAHRGEATSREGAPRVRLRTGETAEKGSSPDEVLARTVEVASDAASAGAVPWRIDLVDEVHVEGAPARSRHEKNASAGRFTLDAERARGEAVVSSGLGKRQVSWGPLVAWSEGSRPLTASRSSGTKEGEARAKGRVLRAWPSGEVSLEGRRGEPAWIAGGADRIAAILADPSLLDAEAGKTKREKLAETAESSQKNEEPGKKDARATGDEDVPPFALVAEKLEGTADVSPQKTARKGTERTRDLLERLRSVHGEGDLFGWLGDGTVTGGEALDYDGRARRASIFGKPGARVCTNDGHGHVHDNGLRYTFSLDEDPFAR